MAQPIRLVLADDHPRILAGLRVILEGRPDMEVVGEAENGAVALALAALHQADVILMDLNMPVMGGLEALQQLQVMEWQPAVIMLTVHNEPELVQAAMARGARGYLLKTIRFGELIEAIQAVARGETRISRELAGCRL